MNGTAYINSDSDGFELHVNTDDGQNLVVNIHAGALEFYENVRDEMSEWYAEAMSAKRAVNAGIPVHVYTGADAIAAGHRMLADALGYELDDPKHPAFHDNVSRIHDERQVD